MMGYVGGYFNCDYNALMQYYENVIKNTISSLNTIKTVKSYVMKRIWMQSVDINTINVFVLVPPVIEGFVLFYLGGGSLI